MPESPEVLRCCDRLTAALQEGGQWMYFVNAFRIGDRFDVNPELLKPALDQRIVDIFTKGKYYFICLANGVTVKAHRGMEGHWDFDMPDGLANTHFRLDFNTSTESYYPCRTLYFVNTRFGSLEILTSQIQLDAALSQIASAFIGRFILSKNEWCQRINEIMASRRKTNLIRDVLLDQRMLCSGIGNYLIAEIMYYAKLHPLITLDKLQLAELYGLYDLCSWVVKGHYDHSLRKVIYNKSQCPCGHPISKIESKGRKAWFCSAEQLTRP